MSEDKDAPVIDHDYDGIQEYDNPLPMWWLVTFFATVIFGFHYWIHYEFGGAPTQKQELAVDLGAISKLRGPEESKEPSAEDLEKLAGSAAAVEQGRGVFQGKCAVCHGNDLQGNIGPNLTDDYWLHGKGTASDISGIVRKGVLDKGMPAWETQLKSDEISAVAVFVASKKGSNPPGAKAPQGEKVAN
jgi:cytochrome c oxidase cbb3-type subunit 3